MSAEDAFAEDCICFASANTVRQSDIGASSSLLLGSDVLQLEVLWCSFSCAATCEGVKLRHSLCLCCRRLAAVWLWETGESTVKSSSSSSRSDRTARSGTAAKLLLSVRLQQRLLLLRIASTAAFASDLPCKYAWCCMHKATSSKLAGASPASSRAVSMSPDVRPAKMIC